MCGIVGVCNLNGEPVPQELLERMRDVMAHRGPDAAGQHREGPIGLAHRRLSIIDLSPAGHQPMTNETGDVHIVYNGELFNYQDIGEELRRLGHIFRSRSDTEVLVHAYEQWGEECVRRFNGQFAFAIWDRKRKRLFIARDKYGVKPLYWFCSNGVLLFASEIKAILEHPRVSREVCLPALNEYFTFQNVLSDQTLFEGIRMLPAGCTLTFDQGQMTQPVIKRYWDFAFAPEPLRISEEESAEELYRLFVQAVTRQLMSDVPVGSYLSGGMDSGSITAVADNHIPRLSTFTCGFDMSTASPQEAGFDERGDAEVLASLFKTDHYEMLLHSSHMEWIMPKLIWHLEDLRVGQCYPNYYVARLAGKFVKVCMSGAGGDELFGGYPWRYLRGLNSQGSEDFFSRYYGFWQRLVPDADKPLFFNQESRRIVDAGASFEGFKGVFAGWQGGLASNRDFVNASLYFELKPFLHGLLVVEDKMSMAHSLETRVPFLDDDLVDFALSLPVEHKVHGLDRMAALVDGRGMLPQGQDFETNDGKAVLRKAMSRLIPAAVTQRKKQGFSAPDASWFRNENKAYINGLLRDPKAAIYEYLEPAYVNQALDQHFAGSANRRLLVWSLLSFEWWCRRFMR